RRRWGAPGGISSAPSAARCRSSAPKRTCVPMARRILLALVLVAAAAGVAALYVRHRPAGDVSLAEYAAPAKRQKYQCAMHPEIVSDEPGNCPICGMKLQPVDGEAAAAPTGGGRTIAFYRHPMRPQAPAPVPAKG